MRQQLSGAPWGLSQSTGSGAPTAPGGLDPLPAAVSLPQPVHQLRQPAQPCSMPQVGYTLRTPAQRCRARDNLSLEHIDHASGLQACLRLLTTMQSL